MRDYITTNDGRLVAEFSETVSGRKNDRPQLAMALTTCRIMGAVLVIGRLDRLSRYVAMIARLMESGLDFVADFPYANKFTIQVLAAVMVLSEVGENAVHVDEELHYPKPPFSSAQGSRTARNWCALIEIADGTDPMVAVGDDQR